MTPRNINNERSSNNHAVQNMSPPLTLREPTSPDNESIFTNVDAAYVLNILKHQASKNHNKIEEEDLTLCI